LRFFRKLLEMLLLQMNLKMLKIVLQMGLQFPDLLHPAEFFR